MPVRRGELDIQERGRAIAITVVQDERFASAAEVVGAADPVTLPWPDLREAHRMVLLVGKQIAAVTLGALHAAVASCLEEENRAPLGRIREGGVVAPNVSGPGGTRESRRTLVFRDREGDVVEGDELLGRTRRIAQAVAEAREPLAGSELSGAAAVIAEARRELPAHLRVGGTGERPAAHLAVVRDRETRLCGRKHGPRIRVANARRRLRRANRRARAVLAGDLPQALDTRIPEESLVEQAHVEEGVRIAPDAEPAGREPPAGPEQRGIRGVGADREREAVGAAERRVVARSAGRVEAPAQRLAEEEKLAQVRERVVDRRKHAATGGVARLRSGREQRAQLPVQVGFRGSGRAAIDA